MKLAMTWPGAHHAPAGPCCGEATSRTQVGTTDKDCVVFVCLFVFIHSFHSFIHSFDSFNSIHVCIRHIFLCNRCCPTLSAFCPCPGRQAGQVLTCFAADGGLRPVSLVPLFPGVIRPEETSRLPLMIGGQAQPISLKLRRRTAQCAPPTSAFDGQAQPRALLPVLVACGSPR